VSSFRSGDDLDQQAAAVVAERTDLRPRAAVVLGSGLGDALSIEEEAGFAYPELPGFPPAGVPGHAGRLILGRLSGVPVAVFSGRFHLYEGHPVDVLALLPRLASALGVTTLVITAAVGGLQPQLPAGSVVVVTDHINMMGTTPLRGWRDADGTPAFVDARGIYDPVLRAQALDAASGLGIRAAEGVYAAMAGPAYETPAEVEMLRRLGADVVGMSMVPEAMPARALGLRVLGLCSLTNAYGTHVTHEEVVRVSNQTAGAMGRLLVDLLPHLPQ
jgi:purine-nucleoside phosphorylase